MQSAIYQQKLTAILYDAERFPRPSPQCFDPNYWVHACPVAAGRGATWLLRQDEWYQKVNQRYQVDTLQQSQAHGTSIPSMDTAPAAVLKWYRRGGLVAPILGDRYWYSGWENSRAWREWRLLSRLWQSGLPVPRPGMAYVERHGRFYRCALISDYIPDTRPLTALDPLHFKDQSLWQNIGQMLKQLCQAGVSHPDFNLSNILVNTHGHLFCIDFDRAAFNPHKPCSSIPQIKRLLRSYQKHLHSMPEPSMEQLMPSGLQVEAYIRSGM